MAVAIGVPPQIIRTTHADTNAVQYTFTTNTNRVTVTFIGQAGKIALSGTDAAAIDSDNQPIAADTPFTLKLVDGKARENDLELFVACDTACDVTVIAEDD